MQRKEKGEQTAKRPCFWPQVHMARCACTQMSADGVSARLFAAWRAGALRWLFYDASHADLLLGLHMLHALSPGQQASRSSARWTGQREARRLVVQVQLSQRRARRAENTHTRAKSVHPRCPLSVKRQK